jgi:Icc-related predicted phosphoesterase
MKLWIISDLHMEHATPRPYHLKMPEADLLIIAGDLSTWPGTISSAVDLTEGRLPTILVGGNHEYYNISSNVDEINERLYKELDTNNIIFLENTTFIHSTVRFIGATLWTDYNLYGTKEKSLALAKRGISDFYYIGAADGKDLGEYLCEKHEESKQYILSEINKPFDGKTVVITHHLPSDKSINPKYKDDKLNPTFASDLDDILGCGKINLWIHGHTHSSCDYVIGNTRVICNPQGYRRVDWIHREYENPLWNPALVVEI